MNQPAKSNPYEEERELGAWAIVLEVKRVVHLKWKPKWNVPIRNVRNDKEEMFPSKRGACWVPVEDKPFWI